MAAQQPLPSDPDALEALFHNEIGSLQDFPFDTSRAGKSVFEILRAESNATVFLSLIEKHPDLLSLFQDPSNGEHTVFVPLDSAWKLNDELLRQLQDDEDVRRAVLSAHISPHDVTTESLTLMANVRTLLQPPMQTDGKSSGHSALTSTRSMRSQPSLLATSSPRMAFCTSLIRH